MRFSKSINPDLTLQELKDPVSMQTFGPVFSINPSFMKLRVSLGTSWRKEDEREIREIIGCKKGHTRWMVLGLSLAFRDK